MRITNKVLSNNMLNNMYQSMWKMSDLQTQITTGKKVNKPSDDPSANITSLRMRTKILQNDQFKKNATEINAWLGTAEDALIGLGEVLQRSRELAVKGATGTNDPGALNAIADEIDQLLLEAEILANSQVSDRYVFGGTNTKDKVFDLATDTWKGNSKLLDLEIGENILTSMNVDGKKIFNISGEPIQSQTTNVSNPANGLGISAVNLSGTEKTGNYQLVVESNGNLDEVNLLWRDENGFVFASLEGFDLNSLNDDQFDSITLPGLEGYSDITITVDSNIAQVSWQAVSDDAAGTTAATEIEISLQGTALTDAGATDISAVSLTGGMPEEGSYRIVFFENEDNDIVGKIQFDDGTGFRDLLTDDEEPMPYTTGAIDPTIGGTYTLNFVDSKGQNASISFISQNGQIADGDHIDFEVYDHDKSDSLFGTLRKMSADLRAGNMDSVGSEILIRLDAHINTMLSARAEIGARQNRIEMTMNRLDAMEINYTKVLSDTEDADLAEVIIRLKEQENVYNATLATGARIIQPTLVDFLR